MPTPSRYVAKSGNVTWRVRFRIGDVGTSETFDTRADAAHFAKLVKALGPERAIEETYAERAEPSAPTLDDWAARYFAALTGITPGTLTSYRRIYAHRWSPDLGKTPLDGLTREHIAAALMTQTGADKTIRNAWGVLASMLKQAVADGLLTRSPAVGVRLPRATEHEATEHRYLTLPELGRLLDALPAHWRPLVWLLAGTGCRWGEAVALTVADIDTAHATARINKAVKWDPSRSARIVGPTKTRKSRRTVTLPAEVVDVLAPLLTRPGDAALFVAPRGGDVRHRTFWSDVWLPAVKAAQLAPPRPRIHDLRHSHVAWLIAQGVPLPVIQARLGHEHITTTIDTYGHLMPDLQVAAADAASRALSGLDVGPRQIEG